MADDLAATTVDSTNEIAGDINELENLRPSEMEMEGLIARNEMETEKQPDEDAAITVDSRIVNDEIAESVNELENLRPSEMEMEGLIARNEMETEKQPDEDAAITDEIADSVEELENSTPINEIDGLTPMNERMDFTPRLPEDIVNEIFARLPVKTIMICRCVSQSWSQRTFQQSFMALYFNQTQPHTNFLISYFPLHYETEYYKPLFDLHYDEALDDYNGIGFLESLPIGLVQGSGSNGLVCSIGYDGGIFAINPFTRSFVKLPEPYDFFWHPCLIFTDIVELGFDSILNQFKAITIRPHNRRLGSDELAVISVCTLSVGDFSWRFLGSAPVRVYKPSGVFVNGAIHWVCRRSSDIFFLAIDIAPEVIRVMIPPQSSLNHHILCDLDSRLSVTGVSRLDGRVEVWVMEVYGVDTSWTQRYRIDFTAIRPYKVATICLQGNGELLMLVRRGLYSYSPRTMTFRRIGFGEAELPNYFRVINYVPTLVSPPVHTKKNKAKLD